MQAILGKSAPVPLALCLIGAWLITSSQLFAQEPTKRPNVVIIFMDDMGYGDPAAYGNALNQTPMLDKLAMQGARLTHFYAAQGVCSASRAALMTGCYPNRLSISGALFPDATVGLHPNEVTIADMLKGAGYRTAMVGKWHLGSLPQFLPTRQGFDSYFGIPYSNDMWPVDFDGKPVDTSHRKARFPPLPLMRNEGIDRHIATLTEQGMITQWYTREAVNFIQQQQPEKPFLLYLAHSMPHVPIYASPDFLHSTGKGLYADMMAELDWSVAQIINTLQAKNLYNNTLIVVTSDNGPWLTFGNHSGNTGGLREGKGTAFEGGVRVPCFMVWPGHIAAGKLLQGLTTTMDLLPTIASITGATLPSNTIDGIDISDYLTGKTNISPRESFAYYYDRNNLKAIRKNEWKLVFAARSQTYLQYPPGMDGHPGKYGDTAVVKALYNLQWDPGETRDLQLMFPGIVKDMDRIADEYRTKLGDDLTGIKGTETRSAGKIND